MTAKQMHIDFTLGLQKVGGASRRKIYPGQIDEYLNQAVDQFIQDNVKYEIIGEHFHRIQVDVDKIKTLLVRDRVININQKTSYATGIRKASTPLPFDYAYLVSDNLGLVQDCVDEPQTAANATEYIYAFPLENSAADPIPYYAEVVILLDAVPVLDLEEDLTQAFADSPYTGYPNVSDKIFVKDLILEVVREKIRAGSLHASILGIYWERYGSTYKPNNFIVITNTFYSALSITVDGDDLTYVPTSTVGSRVTTDPAVYKTSRLARGNDIDVILSTPYLKPIKTSPVSLIADNEFIAYTPESTIVTKAVLTYIRKPSKIDVSLHRNCELPEEFHREIVERALEYVAGKIEQVPLYQVQKDINSENTK